MTSATTVVRDWSAAARLLASTAVDSAPQRRADPFLLGADGAQHTAVRAAYERALAATNLDAAAMVGPVIDDLEARVTHGGEADLHADLARPLVGRLLAVYLDLDLADPLPLVDAARIAARLGAGDQHFDHDAAAALAYLDAAVTGAVRADGAGISTHLRGSGLAPDVVTSLTRLTILGGAETTARLIVETAVQALGPGVARPARAALAAAPPLRRILRRALRPITVDGQAVDARALVAFELPTGVPGAAFGAGAHRCPGRIHAMALATEVGRRLQPRRLRLVELAYTPGTFGGPTVARVAAA